MKRPPAEAARSIFLMGMMGSGKSTLGRALADELGRRFVDLDDRVAQRAGFAIPEIFARYGESRFRDLESAALAELRQTNGLVVALGGGTPLRAANRRMLREGGCVVYLRTRPATLVRRLGQQTDRPLLRDADDPEATLRKLLAEREPLYEESAHVVIENESEEDVAVRELVRVLTHQGWLRP